MCDNMKGVTAPKIKVRVRRRVRRRVRVRALTLPSAGLPEGWLAG